jgi:ankyrin repeat protein
MPDNAIKPGLIKYLPQYLEQRNEEYKALYKHWLSGADDDRYAPATWPTDRCMLTSLPAELLLLICQRLYQADLLHLALTCRALAGIAIHLLYRCDISDFDCLALRWACTFGIVPTLERTLSYGAPPDHAFRIDSHAKCRWVFAVPFVPPFPGRLLCNTPLTTAIVANEPAIVRLLLERGVDVNAPGPEAVGPHRRAMPILYPINLAMGTPDMPLFPGFQPGNPQIVRCLLDAGADPNQYTTDLRPMHRGPEVRDFTPLLMAMQAKVPVETVKLLLERGADPTRVSTYQGAFYVRAAELRAIFWGRSPLGAVLHSSGRGDTFPLDMDKIQLLLKHGGAHEIAYLSNGSAPHLPMPMPMLCRYWNHRRIVEVLEMFIAHGADIASWADMPIPPTISVILWCQQFISRRCETDEAIRKAWAAVSKVCKIITLLAEATLVEDCVGPVRKSSIIDAMIPVSSDLGGIPASIKGQTALRHVCKPQSPEGSPSLIRVLLHYGADMNSPDSQGRTALHHAATFSSGDRVRTLVEFRGGPAASGLVVDALDARGWTPLHYACLFGFWDEPDGQVATARLLLENGADVRAVTNNGWTPLSLAAFTANRDLVDLLLDYGAHVRDLFLPRQANTEPTLVPIGRIIFFPSTALTTVGWPHSMRWKFTGEFVLNSRGAGMRRLMTDLAVRKACVATLLAYRLGIPVPLPPVQEHASLSPDGYSTYLPGDSPMFRVNLVDHPFGMAGTGTSDLAAADFEKDMEDVLYVLDRLGLEALVASVPEPQRPFIVWQGGLPRGMVDPD